MEPLDAWQAAAALHAEAHDERTPFQFCLLDTCVALKGALVPEWREVRPECLTGSYRDVGWERDHDCYAYAPWND